jgi:acyl-CoA thioesterase I
MNPCSVAGAQRGASNWLIVASMSLCLLAGPARGQTRQLERSQTVDALSPECRVPVSELYEVAPFHHVKSALETKRPLKVLALGSPSAGAVGQTGGLYSQLVRLEAQLQEALPGTSVTLEPRSLPGNVTAQAVATIMNIVGEVEPDLIVWQVGIDDALAQAEIAAFSEALDAVLKFLRSHQIDAVLMDPPYTPALANDDHFMRLVSAIRDRTRENEFPLVRRSAAMRLLSERMPSLSRFDLQSLGCECTPEYIAHAVIRSLNGRQVSVPR